MAVYGPKNIGSLKEVVSDYMSAFTYRYLPTYYNYILYYHYITIFSILFKSLK